MQIIDKEQERAAEEQAEGKKKNLFVEILWRVLFFVAFGIVIWMSGKSSVLSGKPYPMSVENVTVIPGETTVQELVQAGYGLADIESGEWVMEDYTGYTYYAEVIDPATKMEANTWSPAILVKDGLCYGSLYIYNDNRWQSKTLAECKVSSLKVAYFDEHADQVMLFDIPFPEITEEAVTAYLGKEPEVSDSGRAVWKKGRYSVIIEPYEEGGIAVCSQYELN